MTCISGTLGAVIDREGGLIQTGPFGSQLHQSDYTDDGIPVIMPKDITDGRVDSSSVAHISDETARRLRRHRLRPRTIVLPRRGEITKRAFIRHGQDGWLCGTGCLQIVLDDGAQLLPEFLYYYMEQPEVSGWLVQHAVGTTMLNLSAGIVADLPVRYPSVPDQRRIAGILWAYDDLIENNRRRMALLEDAARMIYQEWFVRLRFPGHEKVRIVDGVPEGWEKRVLADLCNEVRESVSPATMDSCTPYIGLEHMPRRSITLSAWGQAGDVASSKHRYLSGDILFGKIRPYFHKVGVALTDGVASSDAIVIRPVEQRFHSLVLMTVSSDQFVAMTSQTMREGSKMPRADWKLMKAYTVLLPPEALLTEFDDTISQVVQQLRNLAFQNQRLGQARDILLPKLMSGEIEVSGDPTAEPRII